MEKLDLNVEFEILNSKECLKCGTVINGTHHKPPFLQKVIPKGFYGNNIKKTIVSVCDCGEKYISLLRPKSNSYEIISLAKYTVVDDGKPKEIEKDPAVETVGPTDKDLSEDYMKLRFKTMDREELEQTASSMGIKGNIKIMKDATLINKLLNL